MRPENTTSGGEVYECFDCGTRTSDAEARFCPKCGGEMWNLGRERDL